MSDDTIRDFLIRLAEDEARGGAAIALAGLPGSLAVAGRTREAWVIGRDRRDEHARPRRYSTLANGSRQRSPGNRAKSRSRVIQSQPCSIAIAAWKASGIRFPLAFAPRQSAVKISQ